MSGAGSGPPAQRGPSRTGWAPDPTGRFEQRFRVGGRWTARVRVGTAEAIDLAGPSETASDPADLEPAPRDDTSWRPDPTERFDQRWWDGDGWTRHVRHRGHVATEATPAPITARGRRGGGHEPPGWRDDPAGPGQRYWNGHDWTAKRRAAPRPRRRGRISSSWWSRTALVAIAVAGVLLLVAVAALLALLD